MIDLIEVFPDPEDPINSTDLRISILTFPLHEIEMTQQLANENQEVIQIWE
jgi:hypothetical protein